MWCRHNKERKGNVGIVTPLPSACFFLSSSICLVAASFMLAAESIEIALFVLKERCVS